MDRIDNIEKQVIAHSKILKKLVSENLALRAFAHAVFLQKSIDLSHLRDEYVQAWTQAVEQVPPEQVDKHALEELLVELERVLTHRNSEQP